jgi:hypothetical protein
MRHDMQRLTYVALLLSVFDRGVAVVPVAACSNAMRPTARAQATVRATREREDVADCEFLRQIRDGAATQERALKAATRMTMEAGGDTLYFVSIEDGLVIGDAYRCASHRPDPGAR